jgi:hypothetical protein
MNTDWELLQFGNFEENCSKFNDVFLKHVTNYIPNKNVLIRPNDKSWYDSAIRKLSKQKEKLRKKALMSNLQKE